MIIYKVEKSHEQDGKANTLNVWYFSTKKKAFGLIDSAISADRKYATSITDKIIGRYGYERSVKIHIGDECMHYVVNAIEVR